MLYLFSGSDLVEWLFSHVEGFADRRDARKYACNLLKAGFIRHTVNKITFSEQCYYVFGDLSGGELVESRHEKTCLWGFRPGPPVQTQKMARGLKFRI